MQAEFTRRRRRQNKVRRFGMVAGAVLAPPIWGEWAVGAKGLRMGPVTGKK